MYHENLRCSEDQLYLSNVQKPSFKWTPLVMFSGFHQKFSKKGSFRSTHQRILYSSCMGQVLVRSGLYRNIFSTFLSGDELNRDPVELSIIIFVNWQKLFCQWRLRSLHFTLLFSLSAGWFWTCSCFKAARIHIPHILSSLSHKLSSLLLRALYMCVSQCASFNEEI